MNTYPASHSIIVPPFTWVVIGALTATSLDMAFASLYWVALHDVAPTRVMQAIAAYWGWGRHAFEGGIATAVLGVTLFFARMVLLAAIYQAAARRFAALIEQPYVCGALFGLAIYLSNQYVVVPSIGSMAQTAAERDLLWMSSCMLSHMLLIGIPLALFARQSLRND